jgi:hypothetical protein
MNKFSSPFMAKSPLKEKQSLQAKYKKFKSKAGNKIRKFLGEPDPAIKDPKDYNPPIEKLKKTKKHIDDMGSPAKVIGGTKADSTFVKKHHPTFTGGYISKSASEIRNNTRTPKPTREMNSDRTQSNKINEKQAINLANKKGIDTKMWKAQNKGIQL